LGISTQGRDDLVKDDQISEWTRWISAVEMGRFVARDVAGTEPERMAPKRLAELCKRAFKGTSVEVEVIKKRAVLEREYPLLSAVARASWAVDRHQPCVIRLRYEAPTPDGRLICFAGKGVTYDTGGADLKTGGHMAGMSRDKGGAAAVIGAMLSIAHWGPETLSFIAEIGAVRNSVGADSFVSDELITSHAGVRVRIGNTDAEGRLVLADLLSHLREEIKDRPKSHLVSVATLTGHAYRAMGSYSIAVDNDAARRESHSGLNGDLLQRHAERYGEGVAISRLRYQDFDMVRARTLCEDVLSSNNLPSSGTPRGHQFPAAFLIRAAGISNDGVMRAESDQRYRFTHLDIGGSGVEGGDWQHGRPTAAPVLGLMATLCRWRHDEV
jgi:leucyl aminopeptidase